MPRNLAQQQAALVDHLLASGALTRLEVANAFRAVPRHLFLPELPADEVYRDEAIPTKIVAGRAVSSSSQPAMMAIMLEQLDLRPGQRVLEIGAGTGYNAALIGHLVGPVGQVITVDIDDDIVAAARAHLAATNAANVRVVCADGGAGYAPGAPYDRIILTVGAWDITPAWYDQLHPRGRLVLPLRLANMPQESVGFDKNLPGLEPRFISRSVRDCGFMTLRGEFAGPETVIALGPEPGVDLTVTGQLPGSADRLYEWLTAPADQQGTGLRTSEPEVWGSLNLWLGLNRADLCSFSAEAEQAQRAGWPCLFQLSGREHTCLTVGLLTADGLALLDRGTTGRTGGTDELEAHVPFELTVRGYGPRMGRAAVQTLLHLLATWDAAGRPASANLRLRVYGPDYPYELAPGEVMVRKRWTKLVVDWPKQPPATV